MQLQRLPNAQGIGISRFCSCAKGTVSSNQWKSEDLHQDRRQRRKTHSRLLRQLRYADLCVRKRGRSTDVFFADRLLEGARRAGAEEAYLVQLRARVGTKHQR